MTAFEFVFSLFGLGLSLAEVLGGLAEVLVVLALAAMFARGRAANIAVLVVFLLLYPLFAVLGLVLRL